MFLISHPRSVYCPLSRCFCHFCAALTYRDSGAKIIFLSPLDTSIYIFAISPYFVLWFKYFDNATWRYSWPECLTCSTSFFPDSTNIFHYSSGTRIYQGTLTDFLIGVFHNFLYCKLSSTILLVIYLLPCPASSVPVSAHSCCIPCMFTVPCLALWRWLQNCLIWVGLLYYTMLHKATYGH